VWIYNLVSPINKCTHLGKSFFFFRLSSSKVSSTILCCVVKIKSQVILYQIKFTRYHGFYINENFIFFQKNKEWHNPPATGSVSYLSLKKPPPCPDPSRALPEQDKRKREEAEQSTRRPAGHSPSPMASAGGAPPVVFAAAVSFLLLLSLATASDSDHKVPNRITPLISGAHSVQTSACSSETRLPVSCPNLQR
jgi:hypothetical protein